MPQAKFRIRSIVVTPAGGTPFLLLELDVDCDDCGITQGTIAGHHLRTLRKALDMVIEAQPELCGEVGEVTGSMQFQWTAVPGKESVN